MNDHTVELVEEVEVEHSKKSAIAVLSGFELLEERAKKANQELEDAKNANKETVIDLIKALMGLYDLTSIVLEGHEKGTSKLKGVPVPPKYANPIGSGGETWTGRGRSPKWVLEAFAAGYALDDMVIMQEEEEQ